MTYESLDKCGWEQRFSASATLRCVGFSSQSSPASKVRNTGLVNEARKVEPFLGGKYQSTALLCLVTILPQALVFLVSWEGGLSRLAAYRIFPRAERQEANSVSELTCVGSWVRVCACVLHLSISLFLNRCKPGFFCKRTPLASR